VHEKEVNKEKKINKGTKLKVKGKIVPVHAVKACKESRGIDPLILNPKSRWR
jgi:hypothetical protein